MRRNKKLTTDIHSLKLATFFVVSLLCLLLVSFVLKGIVLISKSKFDGDHRFTLEIKRKNTKNNAQKKSVAIISLEPRSQTASIVYLPFGAPAAPLSRFLEIPIDAAVSIPSMDGDILDELWQKKDALTSIDIAGVFVKLLISIRQEDSSLTVIDLARLAYLSRNIPGNRIKFQSVSEQLLEGEIDRMSSLLFSDSVIGKENITIQIINGTDMSGLGNRLARFITNMGGSVVAISTSKQAESHSRIVHRNKNSYSLRKLSAALGFEVVAVPVPTPTLSIGVSPILLEGGGESSIEKKEDTYISDIIITIGKDSIGHLVF